MNFVLRTALLGAVSLAAGAAHAAVVVDQSTIVVPGPNEFLQGSSIRNTTTGVASGGTRSDIQDQTQSLTVGTAGTLTRIGLQLYGTTANGKFNVTISKGAVYNPDGSFNDDGTTLIRNFAGVTLPNYTQLGQGAIAYFDLSDLGYNVAAGDVLSLGVSAESGSRGAWVLGTADNDTGEDVQLISYARGYNVIVTEAHYSADPGMDTFNRQVSGFDRGFITFVDKATSAAAPLAPSASGPGGAETFSFSAAAGERVFIDPAYATGFDYVLGSGSPNILDALFPALASDSDGYSIYALDGTLLGTATAGSAFAFGNGGVAGFKVRGIDGLAAGDPFVTGLTFAAAGPVTITQTPMLAAVPEPGVWAMLIGGFGFVGGAMRRRGWDTAALA